MNICVVMFYDDNIKNYGDINFNINKKYCEKYNLDIIRSNKNNYKTRHAAWERIPLILENIEKYDYLINATTSGRYNVAKLSNNILQLKNTNYDYILFSRFIKNSCLSNNIVDVINTHNNTNFIFSNDINNKNINTGFFIVKNTQYSIDFFKKWGYDEELYKTNPHPEWWDLGVLIDMYKQNLMDIQNNSVLIDYGILQHFYENELTTLTNKPYVFHLAGRENDIRLKTSKKYFNNLTCNKPDNLTCNKPNNIKKPLNKPNKNKQNKNK